MSKIACQFLVITIAYLFLWTGGILTDYDINMDDRCSKITDDGKKADYGNCPYRYYGLSESELRRECSQYITYYIAAETVKCSNIEQNGFDQVFEYSLKPPETRHYDKDDFKRTIIIKNSSIPILRTLQMKNILINKFQLSNLNISHIVPGFFSGIVNLTSLSLDNNNFTEITDGAFSPLMQLEDINLSKNRLRHVNEHTFAGVISLTHLNLTKNNISKIDTNAFHHNSKLSRVDLSENHIEMVPCFSSQNANVNLSHNNISVINISCFIKSLNVSYNTISTISNLSKNIEEFDSSYNKLFNISTAFSDTKQLTMLNLSHNIIADLPIDGFKSLKKLSYLDLSYNQLTNIEFGVLNGLSNLKYLNIEENRLSTLALYAFPLHNLTTFYFGKNFINDFDIDESQAPLLTSISLDGPGWQCANLGKIMHQLKSRNISIKMGSSFDTQNVDGIPCTDENKETKYEGAEITNNADSDFTKSNFYKYLERLKPSNNDFDKNFETSHLYRYLQQAKNETLKRDDQIIKILKESLQKDNDIHNKLLSVNNNSTYYLDRMQKFLANNSLFNYIGNNFTNTNFYKYLEGLKIAQTNIVPTVSTPNLKYFNDDFKQSNFYKYMESFRLSQSTVPRETAQELTQTKNEESGGNGVTYINLISNILQLATLMFIVYVFLTFKKYVDFKRSSEQSMHLSSLINDSVS